MKRSLPTTSVPEPENQCLGCLFMKLEGIPVPPEKQTLSQLQPKSTEGELIDLCLTLQFKEQRELLLNGRLKFGLKAGKLSLKLENAIIPLESRTLPASLQLSVQEERQKQEGREHSHPEVKANPDTTKTTGKIDEFQFTTCLVTTKGSQDNPVWVFQVKTGEPILKGLLKNAKLGTLYVTAKPCRVVATFEVSPQDVYMTECEGLCPNNISKKRRVVLERAIVRHFVRRKLKPYVSRQELRYDE